MFVARIGANYGAYGWPENLTLTIRSDEAVLAGDPRFSFAWMSSAADMAAAPLLIAVHGSERDHLATRDAFLGLAQAAPISILAPLFPQNVAEAGYADGYKFLREEGVDYVDLLEQMVAQFLPGTSDAGFYLFGFSGGAQFAQRYALFAAGRVQGLLLAAPGAVTLLDEGVEWWPGLAGAEAAIGRKADLDALRRVPVAVTVGANDVSPGIVRNDVTARNGSAHADLAGPTRLARARRLHQSFLDLGASSQFIEIAHTDHKLLPNAHAAAEVVAKWLAEASSSTKERNCNA